MCYAQPKDLDGRLAIARDFVQRFDYDLPFAVDTLEDLALRSYSAWPERLYAIAGDGRVAYKGGIGPFLFDPNELADWLRTS